MTVLVPIRSNNSYFGFSKQSTQGVAVAPSVFPRWLDGSTIEIDLSAEDIREGDGSRRLAQVVKNRQMVKIKLSCLPRCNELGFLLAASLGTGADSFLAPSVSTTISATSIGAQSVSVASTSNMAPSQIVPFVLAAGTSREEIVPFNVPGSGTTLTVASTYNNGNGLKFAHNNGDTLKSAAVHFISDQSDGDYYTIEVGLGSLFGAAGTTLRVRDCKVESLKLSGKAGGQLMLEMEWTGIASTVQSTPATVTLENHPIFLYTQGAWTIDGSTTGDALNVEAFDISLKNNLDTGIQTEQLTLGALLFGLLDIQLAFDLVFVNGSRLYQTYFGGTTGTTDAQAMGLGAFQVTFTQPDVFQSCTFLISTTAYTKVGGVEPKKDGKHFKQQLSAVGTSNMGSQTNVIQATVINLQYSQY